MTGRIASLCLWLLIAAPLPAEHGEKRHSNHSIDSAWTQLLHEQKLRALELPLKLGKEKPYPELKFGSGLPADIFRRARFISDVWVSIKSEADAIRIVDAFETIRPRKELEDLIAKYRVTERKEVPLKLLLGGKFQELINQTGRNAANCFNAVMVITKNEKLGHMEEEQFEEELGSVFQPIKPGDQLRPGDILVTWIKRKRKPDDKREWIPGHAMIYLGSDLFFHKPSIADEHPYVFERFHQASAVLDRAATHYKTTLRFTFFRHSGE